MKPLPHAARDGPQENARQTRNRPSILRKHFAGGVRRNISPRDPDDARTGSHRVGRRRLAVQADAPGGARGQPFLWSGNTNSSHNSQHLFDPYSFTHMLHGVMFFWLLAFVARGCPFLGYVSAIAIEAAWELLENSNIVIDAIARPLISLGDQGGLDRQLVRRCVELLARVLAGVSVGPVGLASLVRRDRAGTRFLDSRQLHSQHVDADPPDRGLEKLAAGGLTWHSQSSCFSRAPKPIMGLGPAQIPSLPV